MRQESVANVAQFRGIIPYKMTPRVRKRTHGLSIALLLASSAGATSLPTLSFEQLTDRSELIVTGQIVRSWTDWDSPHKFIWTRYELAVSGRLKGSAGGTVVFSEPGGVVGLQGMAVAGALSTDRANEF